MTNEDLKADAVEIHDLPAGVQGLIQLGRNAIDRVSELERGIAERDETIRQLRAQRVDPDWLSNVIRAVASHLCAERDELAEKSPRRSMGGRNELETD